MDREQAAWSAVRAALDATELTCETRADCAQISIDTDCHAACGALVSVDDAASITSVIDEQNATTCAGFEDEGCRRVIPPCIPPRDYDCIEGRCTNTEEPVSSCIAQEIAWGPSGGLVAFTQRHTLTPCRTFALERTTLGSMPVVTGCENEIEEDAEIQPGHVDEALAHVDVQTALAAAPILYGINSTVIDVPILRLEIDGAEVMVGQACRMNAPQPCDAPIPEGVEALRTLLLALSEQQRALPDCEALQ
jgi:hypothetical protein